MISCSRWFPCWMTHRWWWGPWWHSRRTQQTAKASQPCRVWAVRPPLRKEESRPGKHMFWDVCVCICICIYICIRFEKKDHLFKKRKVIWENLGKFSEKISLYQWSIANVFVNIFKVTNLWRIFCVISFQIEPVVREFCGKIAKGVGWVR